MSLTWHLVWWDLRRHAWLLAGWTALVCAAAAHGAIAPALDLGPSPRAIITVLGTLLDAAELLLGVLLVPLVVQGHSPVGSTAFWMTRPIAPLALLASKIVVLGLALIVVPVGAAGLAMGAYGVPAAQMAMVTAEAAAWRVLWGCTLAALAAVTASLVSFAVALGAAIAALAVSVSAITAVLFARLEDETPPVPDLDVPDATGGWVLVALLSLSAATVLVVQYRHRARARAAMLGLLGTAVAFVAAEVWPWRLVPTSMRIPTWAAGASRPRWAYEPGSSTTAANPTGFMGRTQWRGVRARLHLDGMPTGWTARPTLAAATFRPIGGSPATSVPSWGSDVVGAQAGSDHPMRAVLRRLLQVERLSDTSSPRAPNVEVLVLREAAFQKLVPARGPYEGRLHASPAEHSLEAVLPLGAGSVHQRGAYRFEIEQIERVPGGLVIEARVSLAVAVLEGAVPPERRYFLRNRALASAAEAVDGHHVAFSGFLPFVGGGSTGFRVRRVRLAAPPRHFETPDQVQVDESWIAGAELVIVRTETHAPFERPLAIAEFEVKAPEKTRID